MPPIHRFPHDVQSRNHWKFKKLRQEYGWEGEGRFWVLNSIIAERPNCELEMENDEVHKMAAAELDMDISEFTRYLNFLINDCQLLHENRTGFATNSTLEGCLAEANRRRITNHTAYSKRAGSASVATPDRIRKVADEDQDTGDEEQRQHFENWWKEYPRNEAKKVACKRYLKVIRKKPEMVEVLLDKLRAQIEHKAKQTEAGVTPAFWPHAATWIHNERWNDVLQPITPNPYGNNHRHAQGRVSTNGTADEEV